MIILDLLVVQETKNWLFIFFEILSKLLMAQAQTHAHAHTIEFSLTDKMKKHNLHPPAGTATTLYYRFKIPHRTERGSNRFLPPCILPSLFYFPHWSVQDLDGVALVKISFNAWSAKVSLPLFFIKISRLYLTQILRGLIIRCLPQVTRQRVVLQRMPCDGSL